MPNFDEILNETIENAERPAMAPIGTYEFQITKVPAIGKAAKGEQEWDTVEFQLQAIRPTEDVDSEMFAAWGGKAKDIQTRKSFMFEKGNEIASATALFNAKEFLGDHLGIDLAGKPFRQALNDAVNKRFLGVLSYRITDSGTFYQVGKTAPIA